MPVYSAGIVPVKSTPDGIKFLMLRSKKYWDFPKGKLDDEESFLEAALRETEEESSLYDLAFNWGSVFTETEPYATKVDGKKKKKVARYYLAEVVSGEPEIRPNEETGILEHDEFRWLSYEEAVHLPLHGRIRKVLDWANSILEISNAGSVREKRQNNVKMVS